MPTLDRQDNVFVLDLGDGENRFHPDWIAAVNAALDKVETAEGHRALVTTATGKFYSNGLDVALLVDEGQREQYLGAVHQLLARMLSLPLVTVAALQGHAFAAGAMLSLAHDFRVMRADRGFWCLPEADINLPFSPGMAALIQSRLAPQTAHEAMVTARRFGGHDAFAAGIVDRAVSEDEVRATAVQIAQSQVARAGQTLGAIKGRMYSPALDLLRGKGELSGRLVALALGHRQSRVPDQLRVPRRAAAAQVRGALVGLLDQRVGAVTAQPGVDRQRRQGRRPIR
jgi:Delta3-Delta2-enoyl-CoA isomerase